jgi:hypothetical protein
VAMDLVSVVLGPGFVDHKWATKMWSTRCDVTSLF